jgi:GT2 family glycosyltransferase
LGPYLRGGRSAHLPAPDDFDARIYLAANADILRAGVDPLRHFLRTGRTEGRVANATSAIERSGLFDPEYYLASNLDIAGVGWDPLAHYVKHGRLEGRAPSLAFDPRYYLEHNPEAQHSDLDPILHFILFGRAAGRMAQAPGVGEHVAETSKLLKKSELFDADYYVRTYPDVARAGVDAFKHYLFRGRYEGRSPSAGFDPDFYLLDNPSVATSGLPAIDHYLRWGKSEGRSPIPPAKLIDDARLFDAEFYLAANLDVALSGIDAFGHYIGFGRSEGRAPCAEFDPRYYLDHNRDVSTTEADAIRHYILIGREEGRSAHPPRLTRDEIEQGRKLIEKSGAFDSAFYLRQNPAVREARIDPLFHYLVSGARKFLDPSPNFSTASYYVQHPIVHRSGKNALVDMLQPDVVNLLKHQTKPDDVITLERMRGEAFFTRFSFSLDAKAPASPYQKEAVSDIAERSPKLDVTVAGNPDTSIVIPVYGQLPFVLACLDSLSLQESRFSAEILVIDDCSPNETNIHMLREIPWIRYIRRESNRGFLDSCNYGASNARGKFLILLNSDTRVAEGWLDELVGSFELYPKAGLVGSRLINDDGTLQECGGIFWRDGSAWNYGRGNDASHPKYCFARQVDYVSGASIAVPADLWRNLNGFDAEFQPAYCEDSDLAFRVAESGYEVWVQPLSNVIHYEGKTHGRDIKKGGKAHQSTNSIRLANRWKHRLTSHLRPGDDPDRAANRKSGDRVLFIDAVPPRPDHDAGSIFTSKILKAFLEFGYQVTFLPQENYAFDGQYTEALERLGIECLYRPFFKDINEVLAYRNDFDIVFACRVGVLDSIYQDLRKRLPEARIIFENADLHYLREEREAALSGSRRKKIHASRTKALELELMTKVDCCVVHTSVETNIITQEIEIHNIVEIPAVYDVVPTNVSFELRHDLMFLGGFSHPPNKDAVLYFLQQLWPMLLPHLPENARFVIVGSHPSAEILALAGERVVVTGFVEDLRPYFDAARVFVAPLRYGAGIKGKVIQSLCHGTPSVISSMAAEGIGLVSGRETIVADENTDFVNGVLSAYFDSKLWDNLQTAGYQFVQSNYSWQRCLELLRRTLDIADETWLAGHEKNLRRRLDRLTKRDNSPSIDADLASDVTSAAAAASHSMM